MKEKVTVCIITFNSVKYLPCLLNSIRNSTFHNFSLIFVDNGSKDQTVNYLNNYQIKKTIIRLSGNKGHSYAANVALKNCKTRYLILLDHDTIVDKDLFRNLYMVAEQDKDSDFAVFSPRIIDKNRNETYYGGQMHFLGKMYYIREKPKSLELGIVGTTAPLLDLVKIPKDINFDNDFFIFWNDVDFFYRLRMRGAKIKLVPSAIVYHLGGTSKFSHRGGTKYSPIRAFYIIRNHRLFIIKNYDFITILIFAPCFLLYELSNIAFCLKKEIFIKGYLYSVLSTIKLFSVIMKKRFAAQKRKAVKEKDLVRWCKLDYNPGVINARTERQLKFVLDTFFKLYFIVIKKILWN